MPGPGSLQGAQRPWLTRVCHLPSGWPESQLTSGSLPWPSEAHEKRVQKSRPKAQSRPDSVILQKVLPLSKGTSVYCTLSFLWKRDACKSSVKNMKGLIEETRSKRSTCDETPIQKLKGATSKTIKPWPWQRAERQEALLTRKAQTAPPADKAG